MDHEKSHLVASGIYQYPDHVMSINARDDYLGAEDCIVQDVVDVVCHEHLHAILYELEGETTTMMLDNIVDGLDEMVHKSGGDFSIDRVDADPEAISIREHNE